MYVCSSIVQTRKNTTRGTVSLRWGTESHWEFNKTGKYFKKRDVCEFCCCKVAKTKYACKGIDGELNCSLRKMRPAQPYTVL